MHNYRMPESTDGIQDLSRYELSNVDIEQIDPNTEISLSEAALYVLANEAKAGSGARLIYGNDFGEIRKGENVNKFDLERGTHLRCEGRREQAYLTVYIGPETNDDVILSKQPLIEMNFGDNELSYKTSFIGVTGQIMAVKGAVDSTRPYLGTKVKLTDLVRQLQQFTDPLQAAIAIQRRKSIATTQNPTTTYTGQTIDLSNSSNLLPTEDNTSDQIQQTGNQQEDQGWEYTLPSGRKIYLRYDPKKVASGTPEGVEFAALIASDYHQDQTVNSIPVQGQPGNSTNEKGIKGFLRKLRLRR